MDDLDFRTGRVVCSKMGRDKGRHCIVVARESEDYVLVADGGLRKLNKPKRKRLKHLEPRPAVLNGIAAKLEAGQKVFDSELRGALQDAGFEN